MLEDLTNKGDNEVDMDSLWFWEYIRNNYYYNNNMNTIYNTFVVLFELLIGNQSHVVSRMYVELSGTRFSQVYFYSFKFVSILIVQNVLIAFILNVFIHKFTKMENEDLDSWRERPERTKTFELGYENDAAANKNESEKDNKKNRKRSHKNSDFIIIKRNNSRTHFYETLYSIDHKDILEWETQWTMTESLSQSKMVDK